MDGYNPKNYGEIYPQKVHWNCTSKWAHHSFKLSGWIIKTQTIFESNSHDSSNVTTWGHDRIHPAYITFYLHYIICVFIPFQYIPWILAIFAIMSIHPGGFHSIPWNHFEIHIQIPHVPSKTCSIPSSNSMKSPWNPNFSLTQSPFSPMKSPFSPLNSPCCGCKRHAKIARSPFRSVPAADLSRGVQFNSGSRTKPRGVASHRAGRLDWLYIIRISR